MPRLVFLIATAAAVACSQGAPTTSDSVGPARGGESSLELAGASPASSALFDCSQLEEVRVRFSDPGYLEHLRVGLFVGYTGLPDGPKLLRVWWNYPAAFDEYQEIRLDEIELQRIAGRHVYERVIEHRYPPVDLPTPRQVRAELSIAGMAGGCSRNRDIVVRPAGPVTEEDLDPPCGGNPCTVFVTSTRHDGNLGGLTGADAICQGLAQRSGLSGEYKAWLSDSGASPATRFTRARTPYLLRDGTILAADWGELTSRGPVRHIDVTELGAQADGLETVWTRTRSNGSAANFNLGPDCAGWTLSDPGEFGTNGQYEGNLALWSFIGASTCNARLRMYCFQQ